MTTETLTPPEAEEPPQTRRGRKPKVSTRRNFKRELEALQARVDMAVRLLRKCGDSASSAVIFEVVLDTLTEA